MKYYWMVYDWVLDLISNTTWKTCRKLLTGKTHTLDDHHLTLISRTLNRGYFIILTESRSHLSSWAVKLGHYLLTGKKATYTHALVNVEGENDVRFKFVEAIGTGVRFSSFNDIFSCDSVCILKPKYYSEEVFENAVKDAFTYVGKSYDKRFRYNDPEKMSCVEVARACLMKLPSYDQNMRVFEYMINNKRNLTPQMFRDCPDFEVVLEIKV